MMRWGILIGALAACDGETGSSSSGGGSENAAAIAQQAEKAAQQAQQVAQQAQQAAATGAADPVMAPTAALTAGDTGRWKPLYPRQASASSFLKSDWNKYTENYHPNYAFDDNPRTAWVEGAEGDGLGETLIIPLSSLNTASKVKLRVRNGYQKSDALLEANAAPRELRVRVEQGFESRAETVVELRREMGWQEVELPLPEGSGLDRVVLEVVSVHPGSKYTDTCISDVEVLVDSEVRYNASQEKARRKELLKWVKERVTTAQYFAQQSSGYPFPTAQFDTDYEDAQGAALDAVMREGRGILAKMQRQETRYKVVADHQIPAAPDGLYVTDGLLPYFTPGELHFHPNKDELAAHEKASDEESGYEMWSREVWRSNVYVDWVDRPGEAFRTVYFWEKTIEQGRGTYEYRTEYVVHYGDDGMLDWVYSIRVGTGEIGREEAEELLTFTRRGSKIVPETRQSLTRYKDEPEASDYAAITRYRS